MFDPAASAVWRLVASNVATGTLILLPEMSQAEFAIHPARGDQVGRHAVNIRTAERRSQIKA
jgi:hypothetical protein